MWSGGAREHYASEIKLPWTKSSNCPRSKVLTSGTKKSLIWREGVPCRPCAVHVCANYLGCALLVGWEWACSPSAWPLTVGHAPQEWNGGHSLAAGEAVSVWNVVDCVLLHPRRKWVVWLWWGCGGMGLCCTIGIGLPVVSQNFSENGPPWGTGWCCCGCVLAPPLSILIAHFRPHPCSGRDWMKVVGYLLPHGCLSCGLQGHWCSSTNLVSFASEIRPWLIYHRLWVIT